MENAAEAQLNTAIIGRRLNRSDERKASRAPMITAACASIKQQDQKDERVGTEICELKRGIGMVIRDVRSRAIPTSRAKRESMCEVDLQSGIDKREATASSYYPEEWPKVFICHGDNGTSIMMRVGNLFSLYQGRSWVVI